MSSNLLPWTPSIPAIYDIEKTYLENIQEGPFFDLPLPKRTFPPKSEWVDFLGFKVASRLGVPAGPLLSSNWTTLAAKLGFDVVTYKTIRSKAYPSLPLPNMIYVDTTNAPPALRTRLPASNINDLGVTNSFGMPSMSPAFLQEDIAKAKEALAPGQVLVVSVVGTPWPGEDFYQDFIDAALFAKEAGAEIIEANFSCPNVAKKEGILYLNPETVHELGSKIAKAIAPVPLIIKVGLFPTPDAMRAALKAAASAGVAAVSGINTISMAVVDELGQPALGKERLTSGICGGPIRNAALGFVHQAAGIIRREKLDLTLIGVGGITSPEHFDQFIEAGAACAQSATGMMWDPYLAMRYHERKGYVEV